MSGDVTRTSGMATSTLWTGEGLGKIVEAQKKRNEQKTKMFCPALETPSYPVETLEHFEHL